MSNVTELRIRATTVTVHTDESEMSYHASPYFSSATCEFAIIKSPAWPEIIQNEKNVIAPNGFTLNLTETSPVVQETNDGICFISQLEPSSASLARLKPLNWRGKPNWQGQS